MLVSLYFANLSMYNENWSDVDIDSIICWQGNNTGALHGDSGFQALRFSSNTISLLLGSPVFDAITGELVSITSFARIVRNYTTQK